LVGAEEKFSVSTPSKSVRDTIVRPAQSIFAKGTSAGAEVKSGVSDPETAGVKNTGPVVKSIEIDVDAPSPKKVKLKAIVGLLAMFSPYGALYPVIVTSDVFVALLPTTQIA
jgi:hypothetical protein